MRTERNSAGQVASVYVPARDHSQTSARYGAPDIELTARDGPPPNKNPETDLLEHYDSNGVKWLNSVVLPCANHPDRFPRGEHFYRWLEGDMRATERHSNTDCGNCGNSITRYPRAAHCLTCLSKTYHNAFLCEACFYKQVITMNKSGTVHKIGMHRDGTGERIFRVGSVPEGSDEEAEKKVKPTDKYRVPPAAPWHQKRSN